MPNSEISIAIVVSVFNSEITEKLLANTLSTLDKLDIDKNRIKVFKVPGAVEIPLMAKLLAASKKYDAVICLGAVIRGETNHYEYVCQQVSQGCQQVMLEFNLPVIFGVLTTKNMRQARARVSKGEDAAYAAVKMIEMIKTI